MAREDRGYNKTDQKSNNLIILKRMLQSYHLVIRKSCHDSQTRKNYLLQYTEQYQRKIQSTPDNSNLQKTYKENYKEMKIASS